MRPQNGKHMVAAKSLLLASLLLLAVACGNSIGAITTTPTSSMTDAMTYTAPATKASQTSTPSPSATAKIQISSTPQPTAIPLACGQDTLSFFEGDALISRTLAGYESMRLTVQALPEIGFEWSPDGSYIALALKTTTHIAPLAVVNVETSQVRQLTVGSAFSFQWAPDSTSILFQALGNLSSSGTVITQDQLEDGLYVINIETQETTPLVRRFHPEAGIIADNPQWSPDGTKIAYGQTVEPILPFAELEDSLQPGLAIVNLMEPAPNVIVPFTRTTPIDLRWSPDGSQLAYTTSPLPHAETGGIFLVNANGTNLRDISFGPGHYSVPAWSPDGHWLVFGYSLTYPGDIHIYRMAADGTQVQQLTTSPIAGPKLALTRSGDCLAYLGNPQGAIYIMQQDGSLISRFGNSASTGWFQWQP